MNNQSKILLAHTSTFSQGWKQAKAKDMELGAGGETGSAREDFFL